MTDNELRLQGHGVTTMYFDGFGNFRKVNGVLRCTGYIIGTGAQLNLVISLAGAEAAYQETQRVLGEGPTKAMEIWNGGALAH